MTIQFAYLMTLSFAVDIISAIEFDRAGDHLATGDRGGRVVLFERTDTRDVSLVNSFWFTCIPLLSNMFSSFQCCNIFLCLELCSMVGIGEI